MTNHKAIKFWEMLGYENLTNFKIVRVFKTKTKCLCGTPIAWAHQISNGIETKNIGKCCANRIGIKLIWKTKADYLANAMLMTITETEKKFIRSLQDKLPKWDNSLKISIKQKKWLEDITNHKWHGSVWE